MSKFLNIEALKQSFKFNDFELINYLDLNDSESLEVLSIRNNPLIRKQMSNSESISESTHTNFIKNLRVSKSGYWALKNKNKILGSISLTSFDAEKRSFVGGNYIIPSKIGSGLGLVINYFMHHIAFDKISCNQINAHVKTVNKNALKTNIFFGAFQKNIVCNNEIEYINVEFSQSKWRSEIKNKSSKLLKYVNI